MPTCSVVAFVRQDQDSLFSPQTPTVGRRREDRIMLDAVLLLQLLLFCAALVSFARGQEEECYDNTTELLLHQSHATAEERKVYTLCPNTIIYLGPTQSPLVARSNTHYVCGPDGSAANNCVLSGGENQFRSSEDVFEGESAATEVIVQGITFENADHIAILLESAGDVTFLDCVIRVSTPTKIMIELFSDIFVLWSSPNSHTHHISSFCFPLFQKYQVNAAPVLASFSPLRRGLVATAISGGDGHGQLSHRRTQAGSLNVNFVNTRFEDNVQRDPPAIFTYGVITVATQYHNLNVSGCSFHYNDYSTEVCIPSA